MGIGIVQSGYHIFVDLVIEGCGEVVKAPTVNCSRGIGRISVVVVKHEFERFRSGSSNAASPHIICITSSDEHSEQSDICAISIVSSQIMPAVDIHPIILGLEGHADIA